MMSITLSDMTIKFADAATDSGGETEEEQMIQGVAQHIGISIIIVIIGIFCSFPIGEQIPARVISGRGCQDQRRSI